jgi:monooxygenase
MGSPLSSTTEEVDTVIVGAGLSGIGGAARLGMEHPDHDYVVLEGREASGGTWDLFRYPGIRSDSDMYTLGYRFKPWTGEKALADGPSILDYLRETARDYDVEPRIRYSHKVVSASWDSGTARWTVTAETPDGVRVFESRFLWSTTGYYDYDEPYAAVLPGLGDFGGRVVHPQHWPGDLDYAGQRVVVVGSGATAVTLVPAMAEAGAAHVTMLQRSPTYVLPLPEVDPIASRLRRWLPEKAAYRAIRAKNIGVAVASYQISRRRPDLAKRFIRKANVKSLPEGYPVDRDFKPAYDVWDQRVCFVPDGDLFRAIRRGEASVVTDTIEGFTADGVRLTSGRTIPADLVVTATGLQLLPFGGITVTVDGHELKLPDTMAYRALMLSGVPNFVFTIGYTNASWTLKADLVADYFCRLVGHIDERGYRTFVADRDASVREVPLMDFTSGYVVRALAHLPKGGDREPWKLRQNYPYDVRAIRKAPLEDGTLRFAR